MIFWLTQSHEMKEAGADNRLVEQLAGLGKRSFRSTCMLRRCRFHGHSRRLNSFPDGYPTDEPGTYRLIVFSRVAFNATHTQALFAVSNSCGGLCGGGGAVLRRRENGAWVFKPAGCIWGWRGVPTSRPTNGLTREVIE